MSPRIRAHAPTILLLLTLVVLAIPDDAWGRIGGGQGYGRGGGGGGGGGGGEGIPIELIFLLIQLVVRYPALGIPLVLVFVGFLVARAVLSNVGGRQVHRTHVHPSASPRIRRSAGVPGIDELRRSDPAFSLPVLYDFLILVHRRAHEALANRDWPALAPFVAESGQKQLEAANPGVNAVSEVVVGAVKLVRVERRGSYHLLHVHFESTRLEKLATGEERRALVEEDWIFRRAVGARSLAPEATERLGCPNCGVSIESTPMGACPNCNTPITAGQLQWQAIAVRLGSRRRVQPPEVSLFTGGQESSVEVPTLVAGDLGARLRELTARHPDFELGAFQQRVNDIYLSLQAAWSDGRWEAIRPHVTDPLFQSLRFWIEGFTRHGMRNQLKDVRLLRQEIVKVEVDPWYEAITVRVWGSMKDAVIDRNGKVIGGNPKVDRQFSEYWTYLRAAGSGGAAHDAQHCPSCAAPLDNVSQAGICGYCGSKITSGRFDWVLSRIEQPEAYGG